MCLEKALSKFIKIFFLGLRSSTSELVHELRPFAFQGQCDEPVIVCSHRNYRRSSFVFVACGGIGNPSSVASWRTDKPDEISGRAANMESLS